MIVPLKPPTHQLTPEALNSRSKAAEKTLMHHPTDPPIMNPPLEPQERPWWSPLKAFNEGVQIPKGLATVEESLMRKMTHLPCQTPCHFLHLVFPFDTDLLLRWQLHWRTFDNAPFCMIIPSSLIWAVIGSRSSEFEVTGCWEDLDASPSPPTMYPPLAPREMPRH